MDDSYLERAKPLPADLLSTPTSSDRKSRAFRVAVKRAVKKAKKILRRDVTADELQMIRDEVAKYA